jgi:TonB family protein
MIDLLFVVRSSIILMAGLAAMQMLKKQPAALRHWIVAATVALAASQPAIKLFVPALPVPAAIWQESDQPESPRAGTATAQSVAVDLPVAAAHEGIDWPRVMLRVWLAGVVVSLCSLLAGMAWLLWVESRSRKAGAEWVEAEIAVRAQIHVRQFVRIAITRHPALIVTWGALAPVILLPADADRWSSDRKRLVIAHEMAHLVRRDWLIQLFAEIVRSLYWFNPLFWIACDRLRRESEHASDDIVLDTGIAGDSYATHLIDLARSVSKHRTWLPAPSIARPSTLERRVRAMLNPALNRQPASRRLQLAVVALLITIALPIAAASRGQNAPAGTVKDPMGRPLPDAELRLTDINTGQVVEARTDTTGNFQFPQVAAGLYLLSVRYPGFTTTRQRLDLNGGGTTISLQMEVGTLQERVTVRGGGDDVPIGAPVGTRISQSAVADAPPACTPAAGQLTPPMKIRDVRPVYRRELVEARVEGDILMRAKIGKDGKVTSVDVISPLNADLEDAAIAAVTQWQFTPTYLNCEPIEVQMYVTVSFKIDR